ncbi:hypothetical protein BDP81DRAFT_395823 [Colletotrichum phormii]|uniref:Protein kinase domain-containing protein n=1 Tax=Colletotrichum phormii TaxID=359342 RepID=A0AAJ0EDV1_9PEZI|nr:uncharacterized protein BDP81DRAFT_395823 [Colletotrichum phormii]KAK1635379.1 hypothetical protein BDP81DRAFT_395823 [Colletotrichum phormii]
MASPSPEETAATRLGEDGGILLDHEEIYSPGRRLHLQPHKPLPPYGSHLYPLPSGWEPEDMTQSDDEKDFSLRRLVFHPNNAPKTINKNNQNDPDASIEILCKVVVSPSTPPNKQEHEIPSEGQLLLLKIFDALFWYKTVDITKRLIKVTAQADSAFSDECGAYDHLYKKELTGFPNIAPQFYGGWDHRGQDTRNVAVLATEFIDGLCLDQLFTIAGPTFEVELYKDAEPRGAFTTDLDVRMEIIKQLMDGTMTQEYNGVYHGRLRSKNVIMAMRNKGEPLKNPRAVLIGYGQALVDDLRREPVEMWEKYPTKPHSIIRFGWKRLESFAGWIPMEWASPNPKRPRLLWQWMIHTFGHLTRNATYTAFMLEDLRSVPTQTEGTSIGPSSEHQLVRPEPERQSPSAVPQGQP